MLHPDIQKAYSILDGEEFDKEFFVKLSKVKGNDILDLVSLANKVKNKFASETSICTIMNAKSGVCEEDCKFCAQSSHHNTEIDVYPLAGKDSILDKAKETYESGVESFGIVTSGTGFPDLSDDFRQITDAIDEIHKRYPDKKVCVSIGHMSDETAKELSKHDIHHFNINIQTNPERYNDLISTTHSIEEKIGTIKLLKKYGIKICSGGIIGLGENMRDRVEMAPLITMVVPVT